VLARVVAQELNDNAGFQIVIENRPGAGSNIAAKAVASAAPDGANLLFTGNSYAINQTIYRNPGYATADLRAVAIAALDSQGLAVNAANPARTLADFVAAAKDKPPSFGFGGSSSRINRRICAQGDGEDRSHGGAVPERRAGAQCAARQPRRYHRRADRRTGAAGATGCIARAGGERQQAFGGRFPMCRCCVKPGSLASKSTVGSGILAPAATPDDICLKINSAVNAAVGKPAVNERLRSLGYEPHAMPLTGTAPFLTNSIETWRKMILATGMAIN